MGDTPFNKNLTGDELKQTMFSADQMKVNVSPLGSVSENSQFPLSQLGISLPASVGETGGFEFPTFPTEGVRIGSSWTEDGALIRSALQQRNAQSESAVYQLQRVYATPQGRMAVIHYSKVSNLSGLGLGNSSSLSD